MTIVRLHLVGAKTRRQLAAYAALAQEAQKAGKPAPTRPPLDFARFSGRGVRLRYMTDSAEKDRIAAMTAKEIGEGATQGEYIRRRLVNCVYACIREVTREAGLDEAGLASARWLPVTQEKLEDPTSDLSAAKLFTPKDLDTLTAWFRDNHDTTQEDVEAIMGGAVELADDGS